MIKYIRKVIFYICRLLMPELAYLKDTNTEVFLIKNRLKYSTVSDKYTKIYPPYTILNSTVDSYTYIAGNSKIINTRIGKFCSIGPYFMCGMGNHPINGISTSPMFYSKDNKSNGISISNENKFNEYEDVFIGNDVFIGANVIILNGVKIGDGAVIAAGSVVSKNVPPYAVIAGTPAKILKYRFDELTIKQLMRIKWWEWGDNRLYEIEKDFFNIDSFIKKHYNDKNKDIK